MPNLRRYLVPDTAYFVTLNLKERRLLFLDRSLAAVIAENLDWYRKTLGFKLLGYVIIPDHLHLVIMPSERASLSDIIRRFKSFTGRAIGEILDTSGGIWQSRYYDRAIRSQKALGATLEYIHNNPVAAKLVANPEDYEFSSFGWYHQGKPEPLAMDGVE